MENENKKDEQLNESAVTEISETNDTLKKGTKKKRIWLRVLIIVLTVILLLVAAVFGYIWRTVNKINTVDPSTETRIPRDDETFETDVDISSDTSANVVDPTDVTWPDADGNDILRDKDIINILLIGQDRREGEGRARSDTLILATINPKNKSIKLTSFMRDLYVQIPGYSDNRINAAYQFGGMSLIDEVIETNFGIHIDGNIEVDFNGFKSCIDMLGGVDIELSQAEADYIGGVSAGLVTLNGSQALSHARNRTVGRYDYERTERQREVIISLFNKAMNSDLTSVLAMIDEVFSMLTTDMTHTQIIGYATNIFTMGCENIESYRIPADGLYYSAVIRQMQVLVPDITQTRAYLKEILNYSN